MKRNLLVSICGSALLLSAVVCVNAETIQYTSEYKSAVQSLGQGKYDEAVEALRPLTEKSKYSAVTMVEIGRIRQKQAEAEMSLALSHFSEAAEYLNSGIDSKGVSGPEIPKALFDLASIYEDKLKSHMQAKEIYAKIIDNYPTYLAIDKVYYHMAACEEAMGMFEEAATHYQKIVSDFNYSTYFQVAQERARKLAVGTKVADTVMESQEEWAEDKTGTDEGGRANLELGDMQAESGKYKQAAASYRKAIKDAYNQAEGIEAYRKLVSMLDEKQKDYKGAAAAIEEMLDTYPNAKGNEDMIYKLGQIYENDIDSMKKKVVDGQVRYKKSDENTRKAIEYYDTVTDKYPDSQVAADAYVHKGKLYEELKEYSEAKAEYERFLSEFPQHSEAASIKQKLRDLEGY